MVRRPDLVQDHYEAATHAASSVALPHRRTARHVGLVGSASNTRPVADSRPKGERGVGVKTVSPAARGRSEAERLDADEHSPHDGRYAANGHVPAPRARRAETIPASPAACNVISVTLPANR